MSEKIKAEVMKQFDAGFLAVTCYPQWVANVVPMSKKDGEVRMCVDYRDLNRASPKDDFPPPHINIVVHCLPMKEECPPVKQKVRRMRPDMSEKIKAEVMTQFDAGFLVVTSYPQ